MRPCPWYRWPTEDEMSSFWKFLKFLSKNDPNFAFGMLPFAAGLGVFIGLILFLAGAV